MNAMNFDVFGPFELPQTKRRNRIDDTRIKHEFWDNVDTRVNGLPEACGCYVFSIRAGKGTLPWYVGKAAKQTFRKECIQPHKLVKYNRILDQRRGTPLLYLVARMTPTGRYSNMSTSTKGYADVDFLERLFIGMSLSRNRDLLNNQDTKMYGQITVPGILNSHGKTTKAAGGLKSVLGIR